MPPVWRHFVRQGGKSATKSGADETLKVHLYKGEEMALYIMHYNSPVGKLLLAERDESLVGLWMEGQKYFLGSWKEETIQERESAVLMQAKAWLNRYFQGENHLPRN